MKELGYNDSNPPVRELCNSLISRGGLICERLGFTGNSLYYINRKKLREVMNAQEVVIWYEKCEHHDIP